jgi:hypothetical protein
MTCNGARRALSRFIFYESAPIFYGGNSKAL